MYVQALLAEKAQRKADRDAIREIRRCEATKNELKTIAEETAKAFAKLV
jgi:hypothetical protein